MPPQGSESRGHLARRVKGLEGLRVLAQRSLVELRLQGLVGSLLAPPGPAAGPEGEARGRDQRAGPLAGPQALAAAGEVAVVAEGPLLPRILTRHRADGGGDPAVALRPLYALVRVPGAEATTTAVRSAVKVACMPEEPVVALVARLQGSGTPAVVARARRSVVAEAAAAGFVAEHEDLLWQKSTVFVDVLEAPQEPCEGPATLQPALHRLEAGQVAVPGLAAGPLLPGCEGGVVQQLLRELPVPGVHRPCAVPLRVPHSPVVRGRLGAAVPPHVGDFRLRRHDDLSAAEPDAQGLVQVLAAPAHHLLVVAAGLLPPPPRHPQQATRDHGDVHVVRGSPLEVCIPSQVALC
mmetsp:Transcript_47791/g.138150  ORF Transcript_47791/g.138150 Transcript_47791/m.138150 type:complete len:351 (-) Transcript_47791:1032-2084(-)